MESINWGQVKKVLKFVLENKHSSFYRDKYRPHGLDCYRTFRTAKDFFRIPFLSREELAKTLPLRRLFVPENKVGNVDYTSGTSASEPLIAFRANKNFYFGRAPLSLPFTHLGGKKFHPKRILLLSKPHQVPFQWNRLQKSGFLTVIGDVNRLKETASIAATLEINAIQTTPFVLIHFISFLEATYDLHKIRLLRLHGEMISNAQMKHLYKKFPNAIILPRYGMQELGDIGIKCERLLKKIGVYHFVAGRIFAEIINDEGRRDAKSGELVVTGLHPSPSPLIRYRTGDLVERLNIRCHCGYPTDLLRVLGRKSLDRIKIGGVEFRLETFDFELRRFSRYLEDAFDAHFYHKIVNNKIVGEIIIDLTPRSHVKITPALHAHIEEIFNRELHISSRFSFKDFIAQGIFLPIQVNFQEKNSAPPHKEVAAKRLIPHFDE